MDSCETCKNCGRVLQQKSTKRTAEQLKKPYYYTAYFYCAHCRKLYHNDKFKVINRQTSAFDQKALDTLDTSPNFDAEIWTDGACVHNGTERAKAAWGFVSGTTERAGLVVGKQTNNVAEGLAIYHGLLWASSMKYKKIKVYTDSQISLFNLQKAPEKVKQNSEIFFNIASVISSNGLTVTYEKVLGHSGDPNNERADKLANALATQG